MMLNKKVNDSSATNSQWVVFWFCSFRHGRLRWCGVADSSDINWIYYDCCHDIISLSSTQDSTIESWSTISQHIKTKSRIIISNEKSAPAWSSLLQVTLISTTDHVSSNTTCNKQQQKMWDVDRYSNMEKRLMPSKQININVKKIFFPDHVSSEQLATS